MSDNEYWDEATERAYWDACAQEEAARHEKDNELVPRGEARDLAYEIFNHFMLTDFLKITPADIDEKVDAISAVPREMSAREYAKARGKMCHSFRHCGNGCPIYEALYDWGGSDTFSCAEFEAERPEEAVAFVEAWAREHPATDTDVGDKDTNVLNNERSEEDER
jgi:hypothetical protein